GRRRPAHPRRAGRARRARLLQGEPPLHRPGLGADPEDALLRERDPLDADEGRVRLLARRRLTVGLHGHLTPDAGAARPGPGLHAVRLPERHAGPPQRLERTRARLPVAAHLRRRRALDDALSPRRATDRVAAAARLLLAALG